MSTQVVNVKSGAVCSVYIGRGSKWGNPFRIGPDGDRTTVIARYEQYIRNSPELLESLPELVGQILGCFCKPLGCHGDVLLMLLRERGLE